MNSATEENTKNKRHSPWPWIVVGLLASHVILMVAAAAMATRDRSFAVVPNYYEKGVNWDKTQAEKRASEKLGWKLTIGPSAHPDARGQRAVQVQLTDGSGRAIPSAKIELDYFHDSHANEQKNVTLSLEAGKGEQSLAMPYTGFWEFHATATAEGKTFVSTTTQWVETEN